VTAAISLPPLAALVLGLIGARYARRPAPDVAVKLLTVTSLLIALSTGFGLAVAGFLAVAHLRWVATLGGWSVRDLPGGRPWQLVLEAAAGGLVVALSVASVRHVIASGRRLAGAMSLCRRLDDTGGYLTVVDDDTLDTYAMPGLPGTPGRIVASRQMLQALSATERRVLLAHETAHLDHSHHLYTQFADLAAAANPMLRPVARAVRSGVERWADEVAATEIGDRRLAAVSLGRAGLIRSAARHRSAPVPPAALAGTASDLPDRVRALLVGPPRPHRLLLSSIVAVAVVALGATVYTERHVETRFEQSEATVSIHVA
jgi:hypothetical protein